MQYKNKERAAVHLLKPAHKRSLEERRELFGEIAPTLTQCPKGKLPKALGRLVYQVGRIEVIVNGKAVRTSVVLQDTRSLREITRLCAAIDRELPEKTRLTIRFLG